MGQTFIALENDYAAQTIAVTTWMTGSSLLGGIAIVSVELHMHSETQAAAFNTFQWHPSINRNHLSGLMKA